MPTENSTDSTNGTTDETSGQAPAGQQQQTTPETGGNGTPPPASNDNEQPIQLPEDHPLVKSLAARKATEAALKTEVTQLKEQATKVTQLEEELSKRPTTEAVEQLQTRYDRLEAFLQAAGGPLGKALDSKSFTTALFESDKDIATIVKDWNAANPSATSSALGAGAAAPAPSKPNFNDIIRAAAKG